MRVLSKVSHDDRELGSVYELEGELLERLLINGIVVPAAEWTYTYKSEAGKDGDQQHLFARVAPAVVAEVAPDPDALKPESSTQEVAPAPIVPAAPDLEVR